MTPTKRQENQLIDLETRLDYYMPVQSQPTPGAPSAGLDIDARTLVRLAWGRNVSDTERDALIRFVDEWITRIGRIIDEDDA